jgi:hypothetical protein
MNWIELLKGPINIISVVFALWLATIFLEQDIKKIGFDGIEMREVQDRLNLTSQELSQIKDNLKRINSLERRFRKEDSNKLSRLLEDTMKKTIEFNAKIPLIETQTVSNSDATLAIPIGTKNKTYLKNKVGYMWIGNYNNNWDSPRLRILNGNIINKSPNNIKINSRYKVIGNVYLRKNKPNYNKSYYKNIKSLGVILENTIITILEKPILYKRHKKQYWVKVQVEE